MKFLLSLLFVVLPLSTFAVEDINLRDPGSVRINPTQNDNLATFMWPVLDFFYSPILVDGVVENTFMTIAWALKNFFILVAVIFLLIGILKLLFGGWEEESVKKWKQNILWVSIGIVVMQIAYSIWRTLYIRDQLARINGRVGWLIWNNILEPIAEALLLLATFGFLAMAIYAFYILVTAAGNEERAKKWKNIVIYAILGFLLIRIPKALVTAIYGRPSDACLDTSWLSLGTCTIEDQNLAESVNIFGRILTYVSSFLALVAVILTLYAGWLIFSSGWEEERLKKAKRIMIYVVIGFIALVASQAIFRFFFLL
jgi:hypothetical protein